MHRRTLSVALACVFIFSTINMLNAAVLKWDIPLNKRLEMTRTARVNYYENDRIRRVYEERNIIDLTCFSRDGDVNHVKGVFSVFHRESGQSVFKLREQYMSDFSVSAKGRFDVRKGIYMPNLRNIPTFPDFEVGQGSTWSAEGQLVINDFSRPFMLSFPVNYRLEEIKKLNGSEIAVIKYSYEINNTLLNSGYPSDFPVKISASNSGLINWDITQSSPVSINDFYNMTLVMRAGTGFGTMSFRMKIDTANEIYSPVPEKEKEQAKAEIEKALPENSGIDVGLDERGIVLRMGEVLFDFDSAGLREDTMQTLSKVLPVIKKKYPDREIIVEGHTDNTGAKEYNYKLSLERANSVAGYLRNGLGHDKFSYRGFGPDRPISDNSTREGRGKNRRVEIIIKLK